jgi:hypothetical protein
MEEFLDTMGIELKEAQYAIQVVGTVVEDLPSPTKNTHARGSSTARIYRIFEARILDAGLSSIIKKKSETCSDHDLRKLASQSFRGGGPGRANAVLTLPYTELSAVYAALPPEARNAPITFQGHSLDETVAAVLYDVTVPKYRRL